MFNIHVHLKSKLLLVRVCNVASFTFFFLVSTLKQLANFVLFQIYQREFAANTELPGDLNRKVVFYSFISQELVEGSYQQSSNLCMVHWLYCLREHCMSYFACPHYRDSCRLMLP